MLSKIWRSLPSVLRIEKYSFTENSSFHISRWNRIRQRDPNSRLRRNNWSCILSEKNVKWANKNVDRDFHQLLTPSVLGEPWMPDLQDYLAMRHWYQKLGARAWVCWTAGSCSLWHLNGQAWLPSSSDGLWRMRQDAWGAAAEAEHGWWRVSEGHSSLSPSPWLPTLAVLVQTCQRSVMMGPVGH